MSNEKVVAAKDLQIGDVVFVKEFINDWRKVEGIRPSANVTRLRIQNSKLTNTIELVADHNRAFRVQA